MPKTTFTEAVGVFHDEGSLQSAADTLMLAGFDRSCLNVLAGENLVTAKLGHDYANVAELEDDPHVATEAYEGGDSRTEVMAFSVAGLFYVGAVACAAIMIASGAATGIVITSALTSGVAAGLIGVAMAKLAARDHAEKLKKHLDKGGLLLWVRTHDAKHERRALKILKRHGADDVHLHKLQPSEPKDRRLHIYGYLDWLSGLPKPGHL